MALAIRMRYMCTHARYYSTHNAHAHRKLMGWAKQRRPRPTSHACSAHKASCVIVSGFRAAHIPLVISFVHGVLNGLNLVEVSQCSLCILAFSLVFTPYLSNAVVSAKSPHYFSCPCSTEAVGIAHKPPHSL